MIIQNGLKNIANGLNGPGTPRPIPEPEADVATTGAVAGALIKSKGDSGDIAKGAAAGAALGGAGGYIMDNTNNNNNNNNR